MRRYLLPTILVALLAPAHAGQAAPLPQPCVIDKANDDGITIVSDDISAAIDAGHEFDLRHVQVSTDKRTLRITLRIGDLARLTTDPIWGARYTFLFFRPGKRYEDGPGYALIAEWGPTGPRFVVAKERVNGTVPTYPVALADYELVETGPAQGSFVLARDEIVVSATLASWDGLILRKGDRLVDFDVMVHRTIDALAPGPDNQRLKPVSADHARSTGGAVHVTGSGAGCQRAAS